ncbi:MULTISPECIES: carboxymuconolactone decarboxylase family protein [Cedecea]|uniref:Alkylhydroperoxidase AhpD family core domain protein n=1 Tax=Cedecea davisae DSM 4568 TaxID=566551 RepID=S3IMH1_9ENTR|nr:MULTISPECIES: carboxymuconolactone decarboxylase family protein [Cedecea]EPF15023.1 alkylhydroperoxidase AhpD family core domain protein [Cedecea davisae DSM 4568]QIX96568.1 carboxymuconolactone decarboxylase family protein [Cedecea sp. FDAARGOS_727]SUX37983.1 Arsenate reductase and related proteins, glutaredoxin family [Cedecea davisae]
MTELRQPYYELSPNVFNPMKQALQGLENGPLSNELIELVFLRVSQINGCAYCLEMHSKALRKSGVEQVKLDSLAGWKVSHRFSDKERAALAWAEAITLIADSNAEDEVYQPLLQFFSAEEIVDLTLAASMMNAFNRVAVGMRQ